MHRQLWTVYAEATTIYSSGHGDYRTVIDNRIAYIPFRVVLRGCANCNAADRVRVSHHAFSRASLCGRPRISATRLPRRAATARGLVTWPSAANVALIMLCGFDVPTDFATISCTPSASKMARIGPPAMMPVPGLAARTITLPAP